MVDRRHRHRLRNCLAGGFIWKSQWEGVQDQQALDRSYDQLDWEIDRFDGTNLPEPEEYERPTGMIPYLIQHPFVLALGLAILTLVVGRLLIFMRAMESEARSRSR